MRFYWLLLSVLAVWRVTHLLQAEDGPWSLVARLRFRLGLSIWGTLMDCFYCLSVWIALPIAFLVGESWGERLLLWPALSAGAILLERATERESVPAAFQEDEATPEQEEDEEKNDAVLRTAQEPSQRDRVESIANSN